MNTAEISKSPLVLFFLTLVFVLLSFDTETLDQTQAIRFFILSAGLLLVTLFLWGVCRDISLRITSLHVIALCTLIYVATINFQALNPVLSLLASAKIGLYFVLFVLLFNLQIIYTGQFYTTALKILLLLFYPIFFVVITQFLNLTEITRNELYGIYGINGHKNLLAIYVFISLCFNVLYYLSASPKWKTLIVITIGCQLILLVILQTRSVWLGFTTSLLSFLLLRYTSRKLNFIKVNAFIFIPVFILLINLFFLMVFPKLITNYKQNIPFSDNIEQINDHSTLNERVLVWDKTYQFMSKKRLLGVGGNHWQIYFPATGLANIYPLLDLNTTYQRPHNDFLWILSEYGIIGFNCFLLFFSLISYYSARKIIKEQDKELSVLFSGLIGYFTCSFFDFPMERIELNLLLVFLISFILIKISSTFTLSKRVSHWFFTTVFLLSITITLISFKSYRGEILVKKMHLAQMGKEFKNSIYYANKATENFILLDPTSVPISWYKGNAFASLKEIQSAYPCFLNAKKIHPYNHIVLNDLATAYYNLKKYDSAVYYYKKALFINPRFDAAATNLSLLFLELNKVNEAKHINDNMKHNSEKRSLIKTLIDEKIQQETGLIKN